MDISQDEHSEEKNTLDGAPARPRKKRFIYIAAGVAILFAIGFGASYTAGVIKLNKEHAAWISVENRAFVTRFPEEPKYLPQTLAPEGVPITQDTYRFESTEGNVYFVALSSYTKGFGTSTPDMILGGALDGMVESVSSQRLVTAKKITYHGLAAIEFLIQDTVDNVFIKGVVAIHKNSLYQIAVQYNDKKFNSRDYKYFINSFTPKNE